MTKLIPEIRFLALCKLTLIDIDLSMLRELPLPLFFAADAASAGVAAASTSVKCIFYFGSRSGELANTSSLWHMLLQLLQLLQRINAAACRGEDRE